MYWLTPCPTVVCLAPRLSNINNPCCHAGFPPLVHHVSFNPITAPSIASTTHIAEVCNCLMYWLTPWPTVVCLAPRISNINNPAGHAGFLPLVPCLLQYHHGTKQIINHTSSSRLQVFDVLTYSIADWGLTCSSHINYHQSIWSCGIHASSTMSPSIPSWLQA
jgi:hypothetical protein